MKDAAEYLAHIKALILACPHIVHWVIVREEVEGSSGLYRYRLALQDGDILEIFERFHLVDDGLHVTKYSFHWQGPGGQLRRRWDNAPHHREIPSNPYHVHDGSEADVQPHGHMTVEEVLVVVSSI